MKTIIKENLRGFLYKNGIFEKMIPSGKFTYYPVFKQSLIVLKANGIVELTNSDIEILKKDANFVSSISSINVPDGYIALHFVNDKITSVLKTGEYTFWNIFSKNTFTLVDTTTTYVQEEFLKYINHIPLKYYQQIQVNEGDIGLLFLNNKLNCTLSPGNYYFWKNAIPVSVKIYSLKLQKLNIQGQEILTSDRVAIRLNLFCDYKINDPVKLSSEIKDIEENLYSVIQVSFREYVSNLKFDEILDQKNSISNFVMETINEKAKSLYVDIISCGIKDIILPGEIRDIMNTVLIAEKKAQANVIARREEVASTRSLLNTAKLMDENATLFKLKEMEYIEKICDKVGDINLSSNGNLIGQLNELLVRK